jgi:hypothetical protein
VWVFWSADLDHWNMEQKAVVLEGQNCTWAKRAIGMPSVIQVEKRLALFYDGCPGEAVSHRGREIGLAWLQLPLFPPRQQGVR